VINLIQGHAPRTFAGHDGDVTVCGALYTPRGGGHHMQKAVDLGMKWALDNGCFKYYIPDEIIGMMAKFRDVSGCLFMVVPDAVGSHDETLLMFQAWLGTVQSFGYPVAFVLQNGAGVDNVPYDSCDALFIGGNNEFKYSDICRQIVQEGKRRGKWIHSGRVNSITRIRYMKSIGCDSFDGTGYTRFFDSATKSHKPHYVTQLRQMNLWEIAA
jgi:hypothetical protein